MSKWQEILRNNFRDWDKLTHFLELDEEQKKQFINKPKFPLNVPQRLANKIKKSTLDDPILKQFLPSINENITTQGFFIDPVQDVSFRQEAKLLKKYEGRALILCTSSCAMHCRYCFRQNFDYANGDFLFTNECAVIAKDSSIREVILSGGDPLSLSDRVLGDLLTKLDNIPHVKRLRFHTRFPIGIPERIDNSFIETLQKFTKQIYFLVHVNHPQELDQDILKALFSLKKLGIIVMNQAVLLKDINDNLEVLKELSLTLVDNGILPYYLNQLDPVQGSAHYQVSIEKGLSLIDQLTSSISGYAVPKYVQEIPGKLSKQPIQK